MEIILFAIIIGGVFLLFWWGKKVQEEKEKRQSEEWQRERFSDETVAEEQATFERRLDENADLPDGIRRQKAYIYRQLMSKWFAALIAKHRYDDAISKKIKNDWINYLDLIERHETAKYLGLESSDEKKRNLYSEEAKQIVRQYMAIEDGFAAAMGEKAIKQLQQVRATEHDSFDRSGRKIAPEGFHYFSVSIRPYREKLKPRER